MSKPNDGRKAISVNQLIEHLTVLRDKKNLGDAPVTVCTHLEYRKQINFVIATPHRIAPVALHFKTENPEPPTYLLALLADEAIPCHGDPIQIGPIHIEAVSVYG
jgi:hypothetical protein